MPGTGHGGTGEEVGPRRCRRAHRDDDEDERHGRGRDLPATDRRGVEDRPLDEVVRDDGQHGGAHENRCNGGGPGDGKDHGGEHQQREVPQVEPVGDVADVATDRVRERQRPADAAADAGHEDEGGADGDAERRGVGDARPPESRAGRSRRPRRARSTTGPCGRGSSAGRVRAPRGCRGSESGAESDLPGPRQRREVAERRIRRGLHHRPGERGHPRRSRPARRRRPCRRRAANGAARTATTSSGQTM